LNTTVVQDLMAWAMDLIGSNDGSPRDDEPGAKTSRKEDSK